MATIPIFTGVGGPILSLIGGQREEYAPFSRDYGFIHPGSSNCAFPTEKLHDIVIHPQHHHIQYN